MLRSEVNKCQVEVIKCQSEVNKCQPEVNKCLAISEHVRIRKPLNVKQMMEKLKGTHDRSVLP